MIAMAKMGAVRDIAGRAQAQVRLFQRELADLQIELIVPATLFVEVQPSLLTGVSAWSFNATFEILGDLMKRTGEHLGALRKRQTLRATGMAALEIERDRLLLT